MLKREILPPPEHLFPPDEWRIIEARWSPKYWERAESIFALSNGYLGVRGTYDEGRPAFAPGVYINGFYESWPITYAEDAFGLARVGQTIVNLADAAALELFVDDEPLFLPTARLTEYTRVLDMRDGTVTRDLVWATASGKNVRVRSRRLVSLEHRHLAAVSFEVTLDHPAPLAIRSRISSRVPVSIREATPGETPDPRLGRKLDGHVLEGVTAEGAEGRFMLAYRTRNSGMTLGLGAEHVIESDGPARLVPTYGPDDAEATITVDAEAGSPVRIVKYLAFHTSRVAPPADLVARCERTLDRAVRDGFEAHVEAQRSNLDQFWARADVVVESTFDPVRVQQAVRWNLFQLAQATWRAEGTGIPAKGLTGGAYDGHYFWDTEIYMRRRSSPTPIPASPGTCCGSATACCRRPATRAEALGHRGATFPWRTINGEEASPQFQSGTAQYHLNADIAYAIRRVRRCPGRRRLPRRGRAPRSSSRSARMWEDLGFYDDGRGVPHPRRHRSRRVHDRRQRQRVHQPDGPTQPQLRRRCRPTARGRAARGACRPRASSCAWTRPSPMPGTRAARAMHIPHDPGRDITPQDDTFLSREPWDLDRTPPDKFPLLLHYHPLAIYRHQVLKQADVVMAMFLLGNEFTLEQKRRNFEYYDPLTTGDSSLSASIQSIVAAEIGNDGDAARYFDYALLMDLADVAGNVSDGVHIASSAGVWMALVFGFGGVRDFDGALSIDPRLPHRWRSLSIPILFQDRQLRITLTHDEERYALEDGAPLKLTVRGQSQTLTVDAPLVLAPGSGP